MSGQAVIRRWESPGGALSERWRVSERQLQDELGVR